MLSAYVQLVAERYLRRLDAGLEERGFAGSLYVMQSNCGVDSVGCGRAHPDHDGGIGSRLRAYGAQPSSAVSSASPT